MRAWNLRMRQYICSTPHLLLEQLAVGRKSCFARCRSPRACLHRWSEASSCTPKTQVQYIPIYQKRIPIFLIIWTRKSITLYLELIMKQTHHIKLKITAQVIP